MEMDTTQAKRVFSRIGLALAAILVTATVVQVLWFSLPQILLGEADRLSGAAWWMWLGTMVSMYLTAMPVGLLILKDMPARPPEPRKLGVKEFLIWLPICFCVMYAGNLIGTVLSLVLSGGQAENAVAEYAMDQSFLKVLVMVILAPVLEEYICRKQLIDRTRQYGEKTAVLLSGLTFALLHQNLYQFFYAFGLGLIFAYIYTRTGRLRYSVVFHMIINFMGSVVAPWILSIVDLEAIESMDLNATEEELRQLLAQVLPGLLVYMLYAVFLMGMALVGLVLLILKCRKLHWENAETPLPEGTAGKTVYLNVGMVLYILLCAAGVVLALL